MPCHERLTSASTSQPDSLTHPFSHCFSASPCVLFLLYRAIATSSPPSAVEHLSFNPAADHPAPRRNRSLIILLLVRSPRLAEERAQPSCRRYGASITQSASIPRSHRLGSDGRSSLRASRAFVACSVASKADRHILSSDRKPSLPSTSRRQPTRTRRRRNVNMCAVASCTHGTTKAPSPSGRG